MCTKGRAGAPLERGGYAAACPECAQGRYADARGMEACAQCERGKLNLVDTARQAESATCDTTCAPGRWSDDASASACTGCSPGFFSSDAGRNRSCSTPCPQGRFGPVQSIIDSQDLAMTTCWLCEAGQGGRSGDIVRAGKSAACEECGPGRYSTGVGEAHCTACGVGKFNVHEERFSERAACNATCDPGSYVRTNATGLSNRSQWCEKCGRGTYADVLPLNTTSTGPGTCQLCPVGRWSGGVAKVGVTGCFQCPIFHSSPIGSKRLCDCETAGANTKCVAGEYVQDSVTCLQCVPGKYSTIGAVAECTECPLGSYTGAPGMKKIFHRIVFMKCSPKKKGN